MKIMKSAIDSSIILSELSGYRADAMFSIRLSRISVAGETAWAVSESCDACAGITASVRYYRSLAEALNALTSVIRSVDEQKQLLRAL